MASSEKPKYPIGTGEEFFNERGKERLPALEVKNTVIKVNPAFRDSLPFPIRLGQPTKLGIFFTDRPESYPEERVYLPVVVPENKTRSGIVGSVILKDRDGILYRDVDVKGIGLVMRDGSVLRIFPIKPKFTEGDAYGLMDYHYALRDWNFSEKFIKAGIRTHRNVAIIDLEEVVFKGVKVSTDEARNMGAFPSEMHPVSLIRAFGTKERIEFACSDIFSARALAALKDAKSIVAQELGVDPEQFSFDEYLRWFADTLGGQVARLRKKRWFHGYLTSHNITLDCRIVDLDSVMTEQEAMADEDMTRNRLSVGPDVAVTPDLIYELDYNDASDSLKSLFYAMSRKLDGAILVSYADCHGAFDNAYKNELQKPQQKSKKKKPTSSG